MTASAERAETYLRLIAEAELRQQPVISGPGPHPHRVWLAAATLAAAGALGPDVAWHVVSDFETSAGLRRGEAGPVISSLHRPQRARQGPGGAGAGYPGTGPAGDEPDAPSAVPIGATLALPPEQEGWYGEFCLLPGGPVPASALPPRRSACWPTGTRTTDRTPLRRSRLTCRRLMGPGSRSPDCDRRPAARHCT